MDRLLPLVVVMLAALLPGRVASAETSVENEQQLEPEPAQRTELALLSLTTISESTFESLEKGRTLPAASEAEVREAQRAEREVEMPWIWMRFRNYAYSKLPQHNKPNFQAVWSPMRVRTPRETIGAVGLKGRWL